MFSGNTTCYKCTVLDTRPSLHIQTRQCYQSKHNKCGSDTGTTLGLRDSFGLWTLLPFRVCFLPIENRQLRNTFNNFIFQPRATFVWNIILKDYNAVNCAVVQFKTKDNLQGYLLFSVNNKITLENICFQNNLQLKILLDFFSSLISNIDIVPF